MIDPARRYTQVVEEVLRIISHKTEQTKTPTYPRTVFYLLLQTHLKKRPAKFLRCSLAQYILSPINTTLLRITMLSKQFFPFILSLATGATALHASFWGVKGCHGFANDIGGREVIPEDGCVVKGEQEVLRELDGAGGYTEVAIAVSTDEESSQGHYAVFFSSEDCNPDNMIKGGFLDSGCSGRLEGWEEEIKNYKSWAVWDVCEGDAGCSL
jgi:hypothetical protein